MPPQKSISITLKTWQRLIIAKAMRNTRSIDEVISLALDALEYEERT